MIRFFFNLSLFLFILFQNYGSHDGLKKNEWKFFSNEITLSQILLFFFIYGVWFLVFETF